MLRELARREREKVKRWREKDKKQLFEHVKIRYLQYRKLKVNLVRVDTLKKERRQFLALQSQSSRKRSAKRNSKQQQSQCIPYLTLSNQNSSSRREGLRHKSPSDGFKITIPNFGFLQKQKSHQESQENTTTLGAQEEIK
jgi:hypothetical protein